MAEHDDKAIAINLAQSIGSVEAKFGAIAEFARAAGVRFGAAMDEIGGEWSTLIGSDGKPRMIRSLP